MKTRNGCSLPVDLERGNPTPNPQAEPRMARVVHFEIHAENPDRAVVFYSALLGWRFQKWDGPMPYWMIFTGENSEPGINGGLLPRRGPAPAEGQAVNAYVCTVGVENLDDRLAALAG